MRTPARFVCSSIVLAALALAPLASAAGDREPPRVQTGTAAFYDEAFQGKETSSGERFDENQLTAAHPSCEPGTRLRVTNLENDRSVEVRANDHGPTKRNRREGVIIDLSEAAARQLGFMKAGEARVRVERLEARSRG